MYELNGTDTKLSTLRRIPYESIQFVESRDCELWPYSHYITFTSIHQYSPVFTSVHQYSPVFTSIHHNIDNYNTKFTLLHSPQRGSQMGCQLLRRTRRWQVSGSFAALKVLHRPPDLAVPPARRLHRRPTRRVQCLYSVLLPTTTCNNATPASAPSPASLRRLSPRRRSPPPKKWW